MYTLISLVFAFVSLVLVKHLSKLQYSVTAQVITDTEIVLISRNNSFIPYALVPYPNPNPISIPTPNLNPNPNPKTVECVGYSGVKSNFLFH